MSVIKIPTSVEEARTMAALGFKWLQDNAPDQLAQHYRDMQAEAGRADKVWMVWAGGARGCIHFINSKGGLFFDETWHEYDSKHSYRLIRLIRDSEYSEISDILFSAKMMMFFCCGSFIDRMLSRGKIHSWI